MAECFRIMSLRTCASLFIVLFSLNAVADEPAAAERELATKGAKKEQVRHSMMGIRDTLVFYTLAEQKAVLVLRIDNSNATLPVSGTVYLFTRETTEEGLAKWINNQHSDGLFPEVPEPTLVTKLPEGTFTITERELVGKEKQPNGPDVFSDLKLKISAKEHRVEGKFRMPAFVDVANVYVKAEAS
jgi:hypothetical protein